MMTPTSYPDFQGQTKLPAVTGKPMAARPAKKKKKSAPMHAQMAAAMEKCAK